MDVLSHIVLIRPGTSSGSVTTQPRQSVDFTVNGVSLLTTILKVDGGSADFMGCLVRGFPEQNAQAAAQLRLVTSPDTESGRILLYLCPECGDIGCGAYGVFIERIGETFIWRDFAYENGYEDPRPIESIGPYTFEGASYEREIARAGAL
ncbi:MAG: hypothetical protein U1F26_09790 [Lysobacterales bacterium]